MEPSQAWGKANEACRRAAGMGPAERAAFLDGVCGDDADLRRRIEALLDAHDRGSELASAVTSADVGPAAGAGIAGDVTMSLPAREGPGTVIGHYKILQEIGEGGFGSVYMAEQEQPVRRRVALKIIKLGMDTKQVVARFEAERQALALMDHPNIAKVLDGGATEKGRPYFVMELVKGIPITEYCDQNNLTTRDRLELFTNVCRAVQHAHQKGIIHRDLKPSNVMVTSHDGTPVPKVIDFGIAKATNARLTERTMFTEYRQLVGTPEYMSPEQAEMSGLDVDTRSDIYSLGVLLYELLTGSTPFDSRRLRSAAYGEIQRIIREEEPHKPSTRLGSRMSDVASGGGDPEMGDRPSSIDDIARHRRTDPGTLTRLLRGDLDWIVMKAMEKDRTRRYETANGLAADIERHLRDEPVTASPPNAAYRFRKFARRNRAMLGTLGMVAAALVLGLSLATYGFVRASRERDEKERARERAIDALQKEQASRAESEAVTGFLAEMLAAVDPAEQGREATVREVLDLAAGRIGTEFVNAPLVEARLRQAIGVSYASLGLYDGAERHLPWANGIHRRYLGDDHAATLTSAHALGDLYRKQGRYAEAERLHVDTFETRTRVLGDEHRDTLASMNSLAGLYDDQGRYTEAEQLYLEALRIAQRALGEHHPETLRSRTALAWLYRNQGRYDEAEPLCVETLEVRRRALGAEHPDTLSSINELATLYEEQGRLAEARPLFEETLELRTRILGEEHPETLTSMHNLALVYRNAGRAEDATRLCVRALETRKRTLGEQHPHTLVSMNELATLHEEAGRHVEAETLYVQTLEIRRRLHGDEHPGTLVSMNNLAFFYSNRGRHTDAEPLYLKLLELATRLIGPEHPNTLTIMGNLGDLYTRMGRLDEGERLLSDAVTRGGRSLPEGNWVRGVLGRKYGVCLTRLQRYEEAERALLDAHAFFLELFGVEHVRTIRTAGNLSDLYDAWGKPDQAAAWRADGPAGQPAGGG